MDDRAKLTLFVMAVGAAVALPIITIILTR